MAKNIGYELRCADPIPYDMEYTRDLGYCAAQLLLEGGNAAMVSIQNGRLTPIPFTQVLDPATGRMRIRMVEVQSESYQIARRYMIRLSHEDLEDPNEAVQYAAMLKLSPETFRAQFGYLVADERKPAT
jgi:6-phosphofructokinase 1